MIKESTKKQNSYYGLKNLINYQLNDFSSTKLVLLDYIIAGGNIHYIYYV